MAKALTRNIALFGGMIVVGLICTRALPTFQSIRGDHGPTILSSEHPTGAAIATIIVLAIATIIACIVGRVVNIAVGLFVLGAGAFALDDRLAGIRELAFAHPQKATLYGMAGETVLLALIALGLVALVFRVTGGFRDIEPDVDGTSPHWLTSEAAMKSAGAAILVLPAVWVIAQTPMKGQAIAAAFIGSMLAGLIGRLLAPHVQPMLLYVSPMIFGAIGYVIAATTTRLPLDEAYINGTLSVFARVMPLDYLAGSLLGVSFGLGWAKSFLHHEDVPTTAKA